MEDYIAEKRMQGFGLKKYYDILGEFDSYLHRIGKDNLHITAKDISDWTTTRINDRKTTLYARQCIVSNFCSFMSRLGYECYVLHRSNMHAHQNYRPPTVFTHEQVLTIFNSCDSLVLDKRYAKSIIFILPSLVRLLYSTGVRIGEALAIRNRDVDFQRKVITITDTKNDRQRLAPVNKSLEMVLMQYLSYRARIPVPDLDCPDASFFVSTLGKPCSIMGVYKHFYRIIDDSGIPRTPTQVGPSLHSMRHTAAVHSLIKMTREGRDIYSALPLLSIFLGHKNVLGTESYVRLTQEVYPEITKLDMDGTDDLFTNLIRKFKQDYENGHY